MNAFSHVLVASFGASFLSHLLAALIGGSLGYLFCAMLMTGKLSDLEQDNIELRSQLNTWQHKEKS